MLMNLSRPRRLWKFTTYGPSGSGKTILGTTAPKPLILLGEAQGYESVVNGSLIHGVPMPPVIQIRHIADLRAVVMSLAEGGPQPIRRALTAMRLRQTRTKEGEVELTELFSVAALEEACAALPYDVPETIVVDSMTEMFDLIVDEVEQHSPPKVARDGLEESSMRHAGAIRRRAERLLRLLRDLPFHVLMLAREDDREVGKDEARQRFVTPKTPNRNLVESMASVSNAVGHIEQRVMLDEGPMEIDGKDRPKQEAHTRHRVVFIAPSWMRTKGMPALREIETANVTSWIERIDRWTDARGASKPDTKQAARVEPSAEPSAEPSVEFSGSALVADHASKEARLATARAALAQAEASTATEPAPVDETLAAEADAFDFDAPSEPKPRARKTKSTKAGDPGGEE